MGTCGRVIEICYDTKTDDWIYLPSCATTLRESRPARSTKMAASYFFAPPIDVEVRLEGEELRKKVDMKLEKEKTVSCPVYFDGESVSGQVCTYFYCSRRRGSSEIGTGPGPCT